MSEIPHQLRPQVHPGPQMAQYKILLKIQALPNLASTITLSGAISAPLL